MTCPKFTTSKGWDLGDTYVLKIKSHVFSSLTQLPLDVSVSEYMKLSWQYLSPTSPVGVNCPELFTRIFLSELECVSYALTKNMNKGLD